MWLRWRHPASGILAPWPGGGHCLSVSCVLSRFSHVWLFATLWTVAHKAPLSVGFSRQEYWNGLPCPPSGDLSDSGIKPASLLSPALAGGFFTTCAAWESHPHTYTQCCALQFHFHYLIIISPNKRCYFPNGSAGRESACHGGDMGSILGSEDPLEKERATQSSILTWEIPQTEKPGGLQFTGLQRVGHDWSNITPRYKYFF